MSVPHPITFNGECLTATRIYAGEYVAQHDNFDVCDDRECSCRCAWRNKTETGVSETDAICNLIQAHIDDGRCGPDGLTDLAEYRQPWRQS